MKSIEKLQPVVRVIVKEILSRKEVTLAAEIPTQLDKIVEFNYNFESDSPDLTAHDMVGCLGLAA